MNLDFFKNKKILIVVPHEDDEICVSGGLLASINNDNTKIIYTTNGNYIYNADVRYKEAIKSCSKLGIKRENIIFLGYSDTPYDEKTHMYTTNGVWVDKYSNSKTCGAYGIDEYCFSKRKKHNDFTRENLIKDIKNNILDFLPDIIVGVDLDFHPDHIMTSLSLEKAIGEVLHETKDYYPTVFKGFAYENAYLGPNDLNNKEFQESNYYYNEDNYLINNPYYAYNDRFNIKLNRKAYTRNILNNSVYKAILCHKSQCLVEKAFSIINPNIVLWSRKTNNLLNNATIDVSSGNKEYLNDFLLCDSNYILNGNKDKVIYNEGIWIPKDDDPLKEIKIKFSKSTFIGKLKIYNGLINENIVKKISIIIDNGVAKTISNKKVLEYVIDSNVKELVIKILDNKVDNGFSEIELINYDEQIIDEKHFYDDTFYSKTFNNIINKIEVFFTKVYRKLFIKRN